MILFVRGVQTVQTVLGLHELVCISWSHACEVLGLS